MTLVNVKYCSLYTHAQGRGEGKGSGFARGLGVQATLLQHTGEVLGKGTGMCSGGQYGKGGRPNDYSVL